MAGAGVVQTHVTLPRGLRRVAARQVLSAGDDAVTVRAVGVAGGVGGVASVGAGAVDRVNGASGRSLSGVAAERTVALLTVDTRVCVTFTGRHV